MARILPFSAVPRKGKNKAKTRRLDGAIHARVQKFQQKRQRRPSRIEYAARAAIFLCFRNFAIGKIIFTQSLICSTVEYGIIGAFKEVYCLYMQESKMKAAGGKGAWAVLAAFALAAAMSPFAVPAADEPWFGAPIPGSGYRWGTPRNCSL